MNSSFFIFILILRLKWLSYYLRKLIQGTRPCIPESLCMYDRSLPIASLRLKLRADSPRIDCFTSQKKKQQQQHTSSLAVPLAAIL